MPRAALPLALAAVLAAACQSSSTPDPRLALADEVERVAELLERDEPCRALDVAEAMPVHHEALEEPVRDAAGEFVQDLRETVQCPAPEPSPTSTPTPTAPDTEPPPAEGDGDEGGGDEGGGDEGNGDEGNDDDDDDDNGRGPPDDRGNGNGSPGGGNGPGRGND